MISNLKTFHKYQTLQFLILNRKLIYYIKYICLSFISIKSFGRMDIQEILRIVRIRKIFNIRT